MVSFAVQKLLSSIVFIFAFIFFYSVDVQSLKCSTLCDSMDCSMPGSSVFRYLLEFAQIHVNQISDAI